MAESTVNPLLGTVNELLLWMPNGEQGNNNLPTLQEYADSAIRQDGALPSSLADCRSYNKVLYQLTLTMVGIARFLNKHGINVLEDDGPDGIMKGLDKAVASAIVQTLNDTSSAQIKRTISYTQSETTIDKDTIQDFPVQVIEHDVNSNSIFVFVDGIFYRQGKADDAEGTRCWYEFMQSGTATRLVKFRCPLPQGASVVSLRFGDMNFALGDDSTNPEENEHGESSEESENS
ncbi:MAG: alginate lyase family protein [Muribaculaceae bacterium]|nr:alginate lyase family protein [Muribaculaceae bacterium]